MVSRRLELLKLEGLGFSQAEIVKELSQNRGCSSFLKSYKSSGTNDIHGPCSSIGWHKGQQKMDSEARQRKTRTPKPPDFGTFEEKPK